MKTEETYDVIIIGGGPGGVSAALYAARGGLKVLVLHTGDSALHKAHVIQNYYGAPESVGAELYESGLNQAQSVGVTVKAEQVTFIERGEREFVLSTQNNKYTATNIVIATGASRAKSGVAEIDRFKGSGVSYCAVCDAFFYRGKTVGVVGAGEFAKHELSAVKNTAKRAVLLTNGESPTFAADDVISDRILRVYGENRLSGVEFENGKKLPLDGLFVAVGIAGSAAFAGSLGLLTDKSGAIVTDECGMTNVEGVYAAGDCAVGTRQIAKAVDDGMRAALNIISRIKNT